MKHTKAQYFLEFKSLHQQIQTQKSSKTPQESGSTPMSILCQLDKNHHT